MLEIKTKDVIVKYYMEPVVLTVIIQNTEEQFRELAENMANYMLEKFATRLCSIEPIDFDEPIQNLQQSTWRDKYFNLGTSILNSVRYSNVTYTPKDGTLPLKVTFGFVVPNLIYSDIISIGLSKEYTFETLIKDWQIVIDELFDLLLKALKSQIRNLIRSYEIQIRNLLEYQPTEAQLRGNYLKTILSLYNLLTALTLILNV